MAAKQTKVSRRMLFTWFMLGGAILFLAPSQWTSNLQFAFRRIFNWPLSIGKNVSLSISTRRDTGEGGGGGPCRRCQELENHRVNIERWLRDEQRRVEGLTGLRDTYPLGGAKLVEALVYSASIDKSSGEIFIDKGRNYGLVKGQFVLARNSIIGTVSEVSSGGARVKLLSSPTSYIPVEIDGTKRFMQGAGDNVARISMMRNKAEPGSSVMVSKKAGLLSAPIIAGKVIRCERNVESAVFWDAVVEPACSLDHLNDVIVIVMNPQR